MTKYSDGCTQMTLTIEMDSIDQPTCHKRPSQTASRPARRRDIGRLMPLAQIPLGFGLFLMWLACSNSPSVVSVPPEEDLAEDSEVVTYAFVGRKISVEQFEPPINEDAILMDLAFNAEYEILEQYLGPELPRHFSFEAYDHYGYPEFATHDVVLLYVVEEEGVYYHLKYKFDRVVPTRDERWITCGTTKDWSDTPLLEPHSIETGSECQHGNFATDVVQARVSAGQFDF